MAELGADGGSGYPGALDVDLIHEQDRVTKARDAVPNDLAAAIIAIETELGTDVAGTATDLVTRLDVLCTGAGKLKDAGLDDDAFPWDKFDRIGFSAYLSGTQDISANTWTKVIYDTASLFNLDTCYGTATGLFTAPEAGKYLLIGSVYMNEALQDQEMFAVRITDGTTTRAYNHHYVGAATNEHVACTAVVDAAASSTWQVDVYHNYAGGGDNKRLIGGSATCYYQGFRVG